MRTLTVAVLVWGVLATLVPANDCTGTRTGKEAIPDLVDGLYLGEPGGLYPGSNERPRAHEKAGLTLANSIQPIDGKIVMASFGMSNTTQEFSDFVDAVSPLKGLNPELVLLDLARGGVDANDMGDPTHSYWTDTVPQRLGRAGLTAGDVQVAWLKQAVRAPSGTFEQHTAEVYGALRTLVQLLRVEFPNLKMLYLSSRTYGGYASGGLSPEPYAYEDGFAVKWLIEDQINGDPGLAFTGRDATAPWLSWGPYLWADGHNFRSDGLHYVCDDFRDDDGVHPAKGLLSKVTVQLRHFFSTDSTTEPWFMLQQDACPSARVDVYGQGTGPFLGVSRLPRAATGGQISLTMRGAPPSSQVFLFYGITAVSEPLFDGTLFVDPAAILFLATDANGEGSWPVAWDTVDESFCGLDFYLQGFVRDGGHPNGWVMSPGVKLLVGE